jgi:Tfp pilus assembly protein PilN
MRAVNLLPSDLRGTAPKATPSVRQEKAEGIGAYLVLGVLALCVAAFAAYVLTTNTIKQREADLQAAKDRGAAASARANALKPYADFQALASARVETVRGLAAARFDWEQALRDLSKALPSDVRLSALNGDMGLPGAEGAAGDPLRSSIQAPAITLTGCASSQIGVARMLARLRAVDGVSRVSLSKSEKQSDGGSGASAGSTVTCAGGADAPTFSAVIFFERSAAMKAFAASSEASASTVPVPNAVNQAKSGSAAASSGTDSTGAAPSTTTDSAPPEGAAAGTSTTTSTTTGSTP